MKHLYIVVEGETELEFLNRLLIPYLISRGLDTHIQGIMITMKGGGHGFNNILHFENTVKPLLFRADSPVISTMIDHYGINTNKKIPNYDLCAKETDVEKRIQCLEQGLMGVVKSIAPGYRFFIPNILRHEFETLLFANPEDGFDLEKDEIKNAVQKICDEFENIEDINTTPEGAPSKRIEKIYQENGQRYKKASDGNFILELTGLDIVLEKCPRFKSWIEKIIETVLADLKKQQK